MDEVIVSQSSVSMQLTQLACQCFASQGCKNGGLGGVSIASIGNARIYFSTVGSKCICLIRQRIVTVLKKGKRKAALLGC